MQKFISARLILIVGLSLWLILAISCDQQITTTNTNLVNTNTNLSNSLSNSNTNMTNTNSTTSIIEAAEPDQYQTTVTLKLEALGAQQKTALPTIAANVARNGADRRMEFNLPNGDKVIYLDKAGTNYLILPNRKQYAVLDKESLGFEVRQLMMPEQIIKQVKNVKGVELVGEENVNGRQVIKYRYGAVTNTQTQAGKVKTESFFLIDKQTGLPLHSETVSQTQNGNVQGFQGLRIVTDMSDIKTETMPELFALPTDYQKIDSAQVKAQADLIFNAVSLLISQALKSGQSNPTSNTNTATPMPTAAK